MALIINESKFRMANPKEWLVFTSPGHENIHPILAGRTAFLCSVKKKKLYVSRGFVSSDEQKAIGDKLLKENRTWYRKPSGAIYKPPVYDSKGKMISDEVCMVAAPGNSNHEFRHALDSSDKWFKDLTNSELAEFGLIKPILPDEPWHTQLIETKGIAKAELKKDYEGSDGKMGDIAKAQTAMKAIGLYKGAIDDIAGLMTKSALKEFYLIISKIIDLPDADELAKIKSDVRVAKNALSKW